MDALITPYSKTKGRRRNYISSHFSDIIIIADIGGVYLFRSLIVVFTARQTQDIVISSKSEKSAQMHHSYKILIMCNCAHENKMQNKSKVREFCSSIFISKVNTKIGSNLPSLKETCLKLQCHNGELLRCILFEKMK